MKQRTNTTSFRYSNEVKEIILNTPGDSFADKIANICLDHERFYNLNTVEMAFLERLNIEKIDIEYLDLKLGNTSIKSCKGDLIVICNALDDYARQIDKAVIERELTGYDKAVFEYYAERCRKISSKLAQQLGYDKEKALQKCLKRGENEHKNSRDVGQDALTAWVNKNVQKDEQEAGNISSEKVV